MFRRLEPPADPVRFTFEGQTVEAAPGDSITAALLAHGVAFTRQTPVSGAPRAAHCMIGTCFDCLVEVDGRPNRQGCLTEVREGMQVRRQEPPATTPEAAP